MLNVALMYGGYSGERDISIKSADMIAKNIDKNLYNVYLIDVQKDKWLCKDSNNNEVELLLNDFSTSFNKQKINFDVAFIIIHGTPGENGLLEGYLEIKHIPHTTCSASVSMLTFNKYYCKSVINDSKLVSLAPSVYVPFPLPYKDIIDKIEQLNFPLFIKPANSGSSVGLSKIYNINELDTALQLAWKYDKEILIEQGIKGRELSCGVFGYNDNIIALPVTEIISKNDFFDYEAKYTPGMSDEITPADISKDLSDLIQSTSKNLYKYLSCFGVVRFDYIWDGDELFFLEVNTIPGMSEASIVPVQAKIAGYSLPQLINILIENALNRKF
ncbi:MAG: D-alanine--D-alanine ligase [Bacteroidales bacterium]|jgi:D-alanine-D-alanine ligase|nr:D-alanine--D-alanine ligase [Bacteroidales bacterium]